MKQVIVWSLVCLFYVAGAAAQENQQPVGSSSGEPVVPRLIRFSGAVKDATGKPQTGPVTLTFSLYNDGSSREPLWKETQDVQLDEQGRYSVLLGASSADGLPLDLFISNEARWLGVALGGEDQQPRVLLVSVPYALKAGDAATLEGKPASAFALIVPRAGSPGAARASSKAATASKSSSSSSAAANEPGANAGDTSLPVTNAGFLAEFADDTGTLTNSPFFDLNGNVGLGTTTPAQTLDINGSLSLSGPNSRIAGDLTNATHANRVLFQTSTADSPTVVGAVPNGAGTGAAWTGYSARDPDNASVGQLVVDSGAAVGIRSSATGTGTTLPISVQFGTSATEVMRIMPSGSVGIGTASPTASLDVAGDVKIEAPGTGLMFPDGTVQTTAAVAGVTSLTAGAGLTVSAPTGEVTVSIANGGVSTAQLAAGAVTGANIAAGQVMRSLNGITDNATLAAGTNITVTPSGGTLTIAAPSTLIAVNHDATLAGNGTVGTPLRVAAPLQLSGSSLVGVIHATNTQLNGVGVVGVDNAGSGATGVLGASSTGFGVRGESDALNGAGIVGVGTNTAVLGASTSGTGVLGRSGTSFSASSGVGVKGTSSLLNGIGVEGFSTNGTGVFGQTDSTSSNATGVKGIALSAGNVYGVWGDAPSATGVGVFGTSLHHGVEGDSVGNNSVGVFGAGSGVGSTGVQGVTHGTDNASFGVLGVGNGGVTWAGYFMGNVHVTGNLSKGGGMFRIDHPLDPANKYLNHSFVESPDMMNIYNGVTVLDDNGEAVVELPDWFEALNRDFRYQLTAIGAPGPNLYIAAEVRGNRFKIAGGTAALRVSWQVTGIRQDAWANAHRIQVEEDKPAEERGFYLHPDLFGAPEEKGIDWAYHPDLVRATKERPAKSATTTTP